jgi:citrate synthase
MKTHYMTAQEAASELGISLATLYAYVSRGLIRSEAAGGTKHTCRYYREDIQKLKERKEYRRNPVKVAEDALHWGMPVMESAITLIVNGRVYYRGHDTLTLATRHTVEQVAALIWIGDLTADQRLFGSGVRALSSRCQAVYQRMPKLAPIEAIQVLLPLAATEDPAAYDLRPWTVAQTGARILRLSTAMAASSRTVGASIAQTLQQKWAPDHSKAVALFNTALILCADHELNVSSFAARCVASAGSTPYAVVSAGLAALQGAKHGGYCERVEVLFHDVGTSRRACATIAGRLKRGEDIPGFGQPLYPDGDPRAKLLLGLIKANFPKSPTVALADAIAHEALCLIHEHPTIDFGLVTLARALHLPTGAALALFALGRTIGWVGQAIEQYQTNRLIRPRARYVGEQPAELL